MFGAIAGGIASALAGGAMSKLFGGGQKAASGGIQGDVLATDNNTVGMGDAGIKSAIQGSNVPNPDEAVPSFTSFSHRTRNKTRDGLIRVRNIRALNGRVNTSSTHAYSIVIGSKHITLNATGGGFLTASKQFRHGATSKSRSNTASNSTKHKTPHLSGWRQIISLIT